MVILKTLGLFVITAVAEIVGCYLPYLWLKKNGSPWLLVPAAASLALFACGCWRSTRPPQAASMPPTGCLRRRRPALALVWRVDGVPPAARDLVGVSVTLAGMAIIVWGGWQT